jgi:hypothetical protein
MKKKEAIDCVNRVCGLDLPPRATHFANINSGRPVWWIDIPLAKLSRGGPEQLHILLYDDRSCELHHLIVETAFLRANKNRFIGRDDRECISLELATSASNLFQDVRPMGDGVRFGEFKKRTLLDV